MIKLSSTLMDDVHCAYDYFERVYVKLRNYVSM